MSDLRDRSTVQKEGRYGGHTLRLGDSDALARYGSVMHPRATALSQAAVVTASPVAQLQSDLIVLGFLEPDESTLGNFDDILKWAIREFQITASDATKRVAVSLDASYTGPLSASKLGPHTLIGGEIYDKSDGISGVVGNGTTNAISAWISGKLRCPVVFQSYDIITPPRIKGAAPAAPTFNLIEEGFWRASRTLKPSPSGKGRTRVFACDFTGTYDGLPVPAAGRLPASPAGARCFPVGRRTVFGKGGNQTIGPYSTIGDTFVAPTHAVVPVSPATLLGKTTLTDSELSTYRVVRAVAQVECGGVFDSLNAYDGLRISAGLYHLGAFMPVKGATHSVTKAELGAYFAYVKSQAASAFDALLTSRGVSVKESWGDAGVYNPSQCKYEAQLSLQGSGGTYTPVSAAADADFLRNWSWFYRFEMAFRTIEPLRRLWWPYARQRVADILSTPWPAPAPGGGINVVIGSVFRSELCVAALLRWHVLLPGNVVNNGKAGSAVKNAFVGSNIPADRMLSLYSATEEVQLFQGLRNWADSHGSAQLRADLDTIRAGARGQTGAKPSGTSAAMLPLGTDRNFQFFADNIPFPRAVTS